MRSAMRALQYFAVAGFVVSVPASVRADERTPPMSAPPAEVWYGWQPLISDGAATASWLTAVATKEGSGVLVIVGATAYLLGGAIVHWAHGSVGKGFASLGLRFVVPVVTGLAFLAACLHCSDSQAALTGGILLVPGLLLPMATDDFVLAYEPRTTPPPTSSGRLRLAPSIGAVRDVDRRVVPTLVLRLQSF